MTAISSCRLNASRNPVLFPAKRTSCAYLPTMSHKAILTACLLCLSIAGPALAPLPLAPQARIVIALALVSAVCWTLEPVSIEITALCLLFALPLLDVASFESTFMAFAKPAVWLVFAGMVISQLITETNLGTRLTGIVIGRLRRPALFILDLSLIGLLLAILIPSGVVRVLIVLPILISLINSLGEKPKSPVSAAIILSVVCATYYGGTGILTASVPNLVIMGVLEDTGHPVFWAEWALYVFPVIGLVRVLVGAGLILLIFRPVFKTPPPDASVEAPIRRREIQALILLLGGVLAWSTDAFHQIHPVMVGLGLSILCLFPGIGPLTTKDLQKVNYPILIYIGSVFALGEAFVSSGASSHLASGLSGWLLLDQTDPFAQLSAITYAVTPFNLLVDTAVVGGILTPPLVEVGVASGLTPLQVGLSVAVAAGMVFLPYQGAPFMIAYAYGYVSMRQFAIVMILICVVNLVLLVPLNLLYWRSIGLI